MGHFGVDFAPLPNFADPLAGAGLNTGISGGSAVAGHHRGSL
jgi:hypothetical protein